MTNIELRNIIIGSKDYEEEFVRDQLSVILEERFERKYREGRGTYETSPAVLMAEATIPVTTLSRKKMEWTINQGCLRQGQGIKLFYYIEAVGDLTTDSFIAALRRFSARRGAPRHIYSDNGTNFVGARRKLDEIRKLWLSLPTNEAISYYLSKSSIDWHFIPPSSPHFGGIWESGIRSVKFHLKRVLGETILTFEELTTLLTQIEGLLNSGLSPTLMTLT
ncbi:DNA double-strand break repair Rad50 ATPase [Trichonephila clavipes]|nr:DNA double-strand break repair Rad50 ATPase [Trichonephila clavipes]